MNIDELEYEDVMLRTVKGPVWKDLCNHPKDSYVASFKVFKDDEEEGTVYDLYLFPDDYNGQSACLRFSEEGSEYLSPGSLFNLFKARGLWSYDTVCRYLEAKGFMKWQRRLPSLATEKDLQAELKKQARELCPDYPSIATFEDLWAIMESLRGIEKANAKCHEMIAWLKDRLTMVGHPISDKEYLAKAEELLKKGSTL